MTDADMFPVEPQQASHPRCRFLGMPTPRKPRTPCPICGEDPPRPMNRYCSRACRDEAARRAPNTGTWAPGQQAHNRAPVGSVRVRSRKRRPDGPRAWVKVAEPNSWRPRAVIVWEAAHGPVPSGHVVHHVDHNTLNDQVANLHLLSRGAHLAEHRPEFEELRRERATQARWGS